LKSDRKIKANRANARMSTGPKTRHGRARSAKNAFRHGLSLTVQSDQALCEEVQALALQIAGRDASAHNQMLARQVAEAQIDLRRIRYARRQFLCEALADRYLTEHARRFKKSADADDSSGSTRRLPVPSRIEFDSYAKLRSDR